MSHEQHTPGAPVRAGAPSPGVDAAAVTLAGYTLSRRRFLLALGAGYATTTAMSAALPLAVLGAQDGGAQPGAPGLEMSGDGYRPVARPAKPGAKPLLDKLQMEDLERKLGCACPCTLDVFTCRTTDFSCGISPQIHRDVLRLIDGGYSADEIIAAFEDVYGEAVLMAPKKEGFNWAGYVMPFAALGTGAVVVAGLIRKWGRRAAEVAAVTPRPSAAALKVEASDEELARLEAAVRREEED